jgi:hypothetical protein
MPSLLQEAAEVLGVELGADGGPPDAEVIAAAFKKLAMRWHPDRNPENVKEATQRFAEISAARDLLVDPPPAALVDEPARAPPSAGGSSKSSGRTGKSENLRQFVGDVSEQIDSRTLGGKEAVQLFETFALWAVWKCDACAAICCRIRKNKYACMCGHRLRDHDAGHGFRCADLKCDCKRYSFMVQDSTEPHRCRCKHKPSEHESLPPHACARCPPSACEAFDSPWVCNCGHPPREHKTAFVKHKYAEVRGREPSPNALAPGRWPLQPPRPCAIRSLPSPPLPPTLPCRPSWARLAPSQRAREWVTGGLRGECVALANKFRARSVAERMAFIERANAAKASGHASWKAMQREAAAHAKWGTDPLPPPEPHACGEAPTTSQCGVCEPDGDGGARAPPPPPAGFDAAAAMRAGFVNSQETTHGLTTAQLRERLAAAGVGVRMATAGDFGLW